MKRFNFKHYLRKTHRYLGLFIGFQFLFWTVGGLYFSWTNIKEIRGEHLRKVKHEALRTEGFLSPHSIAAKLFADGSASMIMNIRVVKIMDRSYYEFDYMDKTGDDKLLVADAITGEVRMPLERDGAIQIASAALANPSAVKDVVFVTPENVGGHHEYRGKPLPAWAVTFDAEGEPTVYLNQNTGQVGAVRTNKWRLFDLLWTLHTMDFQTRDNFNNYLLRAFSVLGLLTILSGFVLFFVSSKFLRGFAGRSRR